MDLSNEEILVVDTFHSQLHGTHSKVLSQGCMVQFFWRGSHMQPLLAVLMFFLMLPLPLLSLKTLATNQGA